MGQALGAASLNTTNASMYTNMLDPEFKYVDYTDGTTSGSSWSTSNMNEEDIARILEEIYKLGYEHGSSAMKRLVNGSERDKAAESKFQKLKNKIIELFRSNIRIVEDYLRDEEKRKVLGDYYRRKISPEIYPVPYHPDTSNPKWFSETSGDSTKQLPYTVPTTETATGAADKYLRKSIEDTLTKLGKPHDVV